jgi:hypothetical protein
MEHEFTSPAEIARSTANSSDSPGDFADQADRLAMIMEAEAVRNAVQGITGEFAGEGSLNGYSYPLEDIDDILAMEDAQDSSDDPRHPGDQSPPLWIPAETAAMHIVSSQDLDTSSVIRGIDPSQNDPVFDQAFPLTPEDETLSGLQTNTGHGDH